MDRKCEKFTCKDYDKCDLKQWCKESLKPYMVKVDLFKEYKRIAEKNKRKLETEKKEKRFNNLFNANKDIILTILKGFKRELLKGNYIYVINIYDHRVNEVMEVLSELGYNCLTGLCYDSEMTRLVISFKEDK
jgi:hypothetical protein